MIQHQESFYHRATPHAHASNDAQRLILRLLQFEVSHAHSVDEPIFVCALSWRGRGDVESKSQPTEPGSKTTEISQFVEGLSQEFHTLFLASNLQKMVNKIANAFIRPSLRWEILIRFTNGYISFGLGLKLEFLHSLQNKIINLLKRN